MGGSNWWRFLRKFKVALFWALFGKILALLSSKQLNTLRGNFIEKVDFATEGRTLHSNLKKSRRFKNNSRCLQKKLD